MFELSVREGEFETQFGRSAIGTYDRGPGLLAGVFRVRDCVVAHLRGGVSQIPSIAFLVRAAALLFAFSALFFEAAQHYELSLFVCTLTFLLAQTPLLIKASFFLKAAIQYPRNVWSC